MCLSTNVSLFQLLVLPSQLICLLCALAITMAKEINSKIRLLLATIFVAEIGRWMAYTVFHLGWPLRLLYQETITCRLMVSFAVIICSYDQ